MTRTPRAIRRDLDATASMLAVAREMPGAPYVTRWEREFLALVRELEHRRVRNSA